VLAAALVLMVQWGYEGTAISMVADEVGVSKATITYHFNSKEDILVALAEPLLDELDKVVPPRDQPPSWPEGVQELVDAYLDILLANRDLAVWLEGDRAVLVNTAIGDRLRHNHERMRAALVGREPEPRARVAAIIALGALWRPVRKLDIEDVNQFRDLLVEAALAPLRAVR
jgi:AcrR family transcriptional regulator